jgi:hypothetical protein
MLSKRKRTLMMKAFVVFLSFAFVSAGFAARIVPTGTVSIIKDGKVVGQFSQEAPLPEGALLRCEAQCAVQLDDVYMVAEPDTVFSISPMADRHDVLVQQGTLYYSLNESSRPLHFDTPAGNATTGDLSMTEGELRGYVRVVGNETEIGVIGGGSMMLETGSGEIAVLSGKKVTMTLADSGQTAPAASGQEGMSRNTKIVLGAVGAAVVIGGGIALASSGGGGNGGGGGGSDGSPSSP